MSRWFRFYDDVINDPKVLSLSDACFRGWVGLLCVASKNNGTLPSTADLAFHLRMKPQRVAALIAELAAAGLIDKTEDGFAPHNWDGRQYKTDNSTERVAKYREKRKANGLPALGDYTKFKPSLIQRDGEQCVYCLAAGSLVVDHMEPIALGGTDDPDNLALACKPCNSGKSGRTPEMARMRITVTSAADSLARYRDTRKSVTVTVTAPEQKQTTEQSRAEPRAVVSGSEKALRSDLLEAFGPSRAPDLARAGAWLSKGYSHTMIVEVVKELLVRTPGISSLNYFDAPLAERHATRPESPSEKAEAASKIDMEKVVEMFVKTGVWSKYAGPEPGMLGCRCPPEVLQKHGITPTMRRMDA